MPTQVRAYSPPPAYNGVRDKPPRRLLFPGIGLLDMAFEKEGFCVVRGPDLLWGGDIRSFHPPAGKFDGVNDVAADSTWKGGRQK